MIQFKTLKEFMNYIPNCVICRKPMQLHIEGQISSVSKRKPRWNSGRSKLHAKMQLEYDFLHSKHIQHKMIIDPLTNQVIEGWDLVSRLDDDIIYANKSCQTCDFKITSAYGKKRDPDSHGVWNKYNEDFGQIRLPESFPPVALREEQVHYTLKGGIDILIIKNYSWPEPINPTATILLNHKYLPPMPFDFDKFQDMEHLNKRIATMKLFH